MILDSTTEILNAFAPTAIGTTWSPTVFDAAAKWDWGMGADIVLYINTNVTATSGGAATLYWLLQANATDPNFGANNMYLVATDGGTLAPQAYTALTKGFEWKYKLPRGFQARYFRVGAVIATAALTAGTWNGWLTPDIGQQDNLSAASGFSVS